MGLRARTKIARRLREVEKERKRLQKDMERLRQGGASSARHPLRSIAGPEPLPREKERFANYFSSGNFIPSRPVVRREKHEQRGRAVFLLIAALVFGFILYRLFFH